MPYYSSVRCSACVWSCPHGGFATRVLQVASSPLRCKSDRACTTDCTRARPGPATREWNSCSTLVDDQLQEDQRHPGDLASTFEYRVNARAQSAAVQWAFGHPAEVLPLAGRKFLRTWSLWPDGGDVGSTTVRLAITLSSFGVLVLACVASWSLFRPIDWYHGICWLPCLYFTLLHMVFVGSVRYREPAVFVLVALAGCALAAFIRCPWNASPTAKSIEREQGSASFSRS
jgi:hypothetical protein